MATTETAQALDQTERHGRRRPFSSWMKKLAYFKSGSLAITDSNQTAPNKRNIYQTKPNSKKSAVSKNIGHEHPSVSLNLEVQEIDQPLSIVPTVSLGKTSLEGRNSIRSSENGLPSPTIGNKSTTAASTGRTNSVAAPSHAPSTQGTNCTSGFGLQGNDSTFSSPAPSVRSLTTTLTTLHSAAPAAPTSNNSNTTTNNATVQFSHQFPLTTPVNSLPSHLGLQCNGGNPSTYNTATANNLLTDNASILTLASSSKRRRKRSIDTDASVRALAPSSLFGGSRESLPLSILSANIESNPHQSRPSISGLNERGSIYSMTAATPTLSSERNSFYANKQSIAADTGSAKSSPLGHFRNESLNGNGNGYVAGLAQGSPLACPRDTGVFCPRNPIHNDTIMHEDKGSVSEEMRNHIEKATVMTE